MLCVCDHKAAYADHSTERTPPPLPREVAGPEKPLVSVLAPTTSDRHWAHANLYRCFDHQNWPNKELVVLDSGSKASPFFTSLSDPRVRYQHLALRSNVLQLLEDLKEFVRMGSQGNPIAEGEPAWHDAWAALAQALEDAEANREWFELEDERGLRFRAIRVDGPACCHAGRKAEPALQPGQGPHPGAL